MTFGRPLLQYFCSECNTLLTETDKSIDFISSSEECPKCGSLLSKTLKRQTQERYDSNRTASLLIPPKFQIASRLIFDIENIDSILKIGIGECIFIVTIHSKILTDTLCISTLLLDSNVRIG